MVSDEMVSEEIGSAWAISRSLNQSCGQVVCLAKFVSSEYPLHLLLWEGTHVISPTRDTLD